MPRDLVLRQLDYSIVAQAVGTLVIEAGQVEGAMCRAVCWLEGGQPHKVTQEVARLGSRPLVRRLRGLAGVSAHGQRIVDLLHKHDVDKQLTVRHNIVHGRISAGVEGDWLAVRNYPDRGPAVLLGNSQEVLDQAQVCRELWTGIYEVMPPSPVRLLEPEE